MSDSIDVEQLDAWRKSGAKHALLDVREDWERDICSIEGSINIPMGDVPARTSELARDLPLVVMCHHGGRSMQVVRWLRANGFSNAVNLTGGIHVWSQSIDPSVPTY